jgi:non-ribosomal peptide synthetase component F
LLIRVRNGIAEAYARRELPLETLVQTFSSKQGTNQNALFQLVFQLQDLSRETTRLSDVEMEALEFDPGTANFDLTMEVSVRPEGLRCALNYNRDLFEVETIDRMLGHYRILLDGSGLASFRNCRCLQIQSVAGL